MYTVSKNVSTLSRYNSDIRESILIIFGTNVTEKVDNTRYFIFPPYRTSAFALPGETGNPEIAFFHLNAACFLPKTRNIKKYHLDRAEPPVTVKTIDCVHQTGPGRKYSILLSGTIKCRTFAFFVPGDLNLWPLTLTF